HSSAADAAGAGGPAHEGSLCGTDGQTQATRRFTFPPHAARSAAVAPADARAGGGGGLPVGAGRGRLPGRGGGDALQLPPLPPHWNHCRLFPNGDLLALYNPNDSPYGMGLVKLDKDSKLLWRRPGAFHHDFDVAEDGRIFALTRKQRDRLPEGVESLAEPYSD